MRLIVTRPRAQAQALVDELRCAGLDAVALPLIDIAPLRDPSALQQAWRTLPQAALAMFVSANAVQHFMRHRPAQFDWPEHLLAGSTGPGTSAALREAGVPPAALVEPAGEDFDSEALWQRLQAHDWRGRRVCIVRGEGGRDWLAERLEARGAAVEFVAAYERLAPRLDSAGRAQLDDALARPAVHLWLFSSSEALAHLEQLAPGADWSRGCAVASHARIVERARRLGFAQVALAALSAGALTRAAAGCAGLSIQSDAP